MHDLYPTPRGHLRNALLYAGIGLIGAFVLLCYKLGEDWRWIFGFPVLFGAGYLWVKLWAWTEGITRDGLTPGERAQRDREGDDWQ